MIDAAGIAGVCLYLTSLLIIGALARRARREATIQDYYLAGSALGVISLFFTLYATQYSGNTLLGVPGQAYREGVPALSVTFAVMGIVAVYAVFAPRLNELARRYDFVTPADFLRHRFRDSRLTLLANLIFVFTLTSYILANLKAIGLLVEGATAARVSAAEGIVSLALVMAVYESLGGMRSVVWTDVLQGSILLCGSLIVFAVVAFDPELGVVPIAELSAALAATLQTPGAAADFVSLMLLVGVGAAVYPQALQRIYAAKNVATLRRSYTFLFVMPLLVMLPLSLVAMSAADWLPGLSLAESERVVLHVIDTAIADAGARPLLVALFLGAALAAIMSTVDSALLSLGSILTKDVLATTRASGSDVALHRISRLLTWLLMAVMATLAIVLPQSIWALMVLKFELLVQVAPAILLGIRRPAVRARAILLGMIAGCVVAVALNASQTFASPLGIHAGIWGLIANLVVTGLVSLRPDAMRTDDALRP